MADKGNQPLGGIELLSLASFAFNSWNAALIRSTSSQCTAIPFLSLLDKKKTKMTEENKNIATVEESAIATVPRSLPDPNWSVLDSFNVQDDTEMFEEALIPPENFNMVCEHVYRSSFPKKKHYKFLEKLKLKSVL